MNNKLKNNYVSDKLYAHHNYFTKFVKLINNNKFPKILMLTGNKGQGKFTLVHHLMAYHFDKINYDLNLFQIKKSNKLVHGIKEINLSNIIYFDCKGSNTKIDDIRNLRSNLQKSSNSF